MQELHEALQLGLRQSRTVRSTCSFRLRPIFATCSRRSLSRRRSRTHTWLLLILLILVYQLRVPFASQTPHPNLPILHDPRRRALGRTHRAFPKPPTQHLPIKMQPMPNRMGLGLRPPMPSFGQGPSMSALAQQQQMGFMPPPNRSVSLFVGSISGGIDDDFLNRLLSVRAHHSWKYMC